jgi:Mg-chelatase subunit ChlI
MDSLPPLVCVWGIPAGAKRPVIDCLPFSVFRLLVGQDDLKKSLLLCAVNPRVGSVLVRGEKGTAKSTLAALLPEIETAGGCAFVCDPARPGEWCARCREQGEENRWVKRRAPFLTLPLTATERSCAKRRGHAASAHR